MTIERRRRALWFLVALIALAPACASDGDAADAPAAGVAASLVRFPAFAQLLRGAARAPATQVAGGFAILARGSGARGASAWRDPARPLRATLGARADAPLRFEVPGAPAIAVHRLHAQSSPGRLDGGAVVYGEVSPGVDALVFATEVGVEELLVVDGPGAALEYAVDVPAGFRLVGAAGGIVELRDPTGVARLRMRAGAAWDAAGQRVPIGVHIDGEGIRLAITGPAKWPVAIDPEWSDGGVMTTPRIYHTSTLLSDGRVLLAGGDDAGSAELYDPRTGTFSPTSPLSRPRFGATATLLFDGTVLVFGGADELPADFAFPTHPVDTGYAELYDPGPGTFKPVPSSGEGRSGHTATLRPNGQVLIAGGYLGSGAASASMVDYDPGTRAVHALPDMAVPRARHAAVALPGGRVLLVGADGADTSTEIFDPVSVHASPAAPMAFPRAHPTAALLPSGRVLVTGGSPSKPGFAELYDPAQDSFTTLLQAPDDPNDAPAAALLPTGLVLVAGGHETPPTLFDPTTGTVSPSAGANAVRGHQQLTLLPSGRVLVTGGLSEAAPIGPLQLAEIYDAAAPTISAPSPGSLVEPRSGHTATLLSSGNVLLAGGFVADSRSTASTELYDPVANQVIAVGSMSFPRGAHTATLLPDGKVLVAGGGLLQNGMSELGIIYETSAELYDPATGELSPTGPMGTARAHHTATLLRPPYNKVLVTGGEDLGQSSVSSAELYDPLAGTFSPTGSLLDIRSTHTATLLPSGQVLLAGGQNSGNPNARLAELYDPATGTFTSLGSTGGVRDEATATLLPTGDVLLAGGFPLVPDPEEFASAVLVGAQAGAFGLPIPLVNGRYAHAAAPLPSGDVLLAGGSSYPATDQFGTPLSAYGTPLSTAELYDPQAGVFTATNAPMIAPRVLHTATFIPALGKVLIAGGSSGVFPYSSVGPVELYDPTTGAFEPAAAGSGGSAFPLSTLTLLPSGKVLVAGGAGAQASTQIYDPDTGTWAPGGPLLVGRVGHTATLLGSGWVLLAGGNTPIVMDVDTPKAELFDPKSGTSNNVALMRWRSLHTATPLPSGKVLMTGGYDWDGLAFSAPTPLDSAELCDPVTRVCSLVKQAMGVARFNHVAELLPSGKVLIAAGQDGNGANISTAEIYDPETEEFTPVPGLPLSGRARSAALASGDVIAVGDGGGFRYVAATGSFEPLPSGLPAPALGAIPLTTADGLACGIGGCAVFDAAHGALDARFDVAVSPGAAMTRLASGDVILGAARGFIRYQGQEGVVRPVISSAPPTLPIRATVTILGQRFTRLSARRSDAAQPTTGSAPLAFFMPASGGGPIYGVVTDWGDDHLTWKVPVTVHNGPGWLHVVVNGVPSLGRYAVLTAEGDGVACSLDAECASSFCTEGVCCDQRCGTTCMSCLAGKHGASGLDGTCGPVEAGGVDPKDGCPAQSPGTCGRTGLCDGKGLCALQPKGTPCGGVSACNHGVCTPFPECQNDFIVTGEMVTSFCQPYACRAGQCVSAPCLSNLDCSAGNACNAGGQCQQIAAPPVTDDSGCSIRPRGDSRARPPWGLLAVVAIAGALRRAARRRASPVRLAALLAPLFATTLTPAARAQPLPPPTSRPPALDEAKALFRQGVALLDAGDVERALDLFLRSRAVVPSGRNTANAAICLDRLGRHDEALEMFEELLTRHVADLREADRASIAPTMKALQGKVGTLEISANVEGATVYVDGRPRGKLPRTGPLRVNAGQRRVRVVKDGYEPYQETVDARAGGSRTIEARLQVLEHRGQLRVEDPRSEGSEVFVDGLGVGPSPWEGTLAPRRYTVWTQRGEVGSAPAPILVIEGQVTLLRVRSGPLGAELRVEADPRSAEIALDDVVLGAGLWKGRLPAGPHQLRVTEAGYRARVEQVEVPGPGAPPLVRLVRLEIDQGHPRWPRAPPGRFWLAAFGGYAVGPGLGADAGARCPADCSGSPRADGGIAGLRVGFRFPAGISIELAGGYLAARSAFTRVEHRAFDGHPIVYELSDTLGLRGFFLGGGASHRRALRGRLGLITRAMVGAVIARADDPITATAEAGGQRQKVAVVGSPVAPRSTPLFVWPEVGLDLALNPWHVGAMLGAAFFPLQGPAFTQRELWVAAPSQDPAHPGSVSNAPHAYLPRPPGVERAYGPFAVLTPHLSLEYPF